MDLEFLTIKQSLSYFNNETNLDADKLSFLIYCLENKISIKYKAVTEFKVIMGNFITDFEFQQLMTHQSSEVDMGEVVDDTIFANGFFQEQSTKLAYNFYIENFPNEYNSNLPLIQLNALTKSHELVKDTKEYKQLLENKKYLDALEKIKKASMILPLEDGQGAIVFHVDNQVLLKPDIYEFLDFSLNIDGLLKSEMKNLHNYYTDMPPSDTRFLFVNNVFCYKPESKFSFLNNGQEIFHQCFIKADLDTLIDKILTKDKKKKVVDTLHTRTANNASKIISALCEMNGLDITKPYGNANKEILTILDRLGTPLSNDVIGDWLKLAHENTK